MIFLLLTVVCSTSIALIMKWNGQRQGDALSLLFGNYFTAMLYGACQLSWNPGSPGNGIPIAFGAFLGFLFFASFFVFARAVENAGAALAALSSRLSIAVPTLTAILWFGESPEWNHSLGFALTVITLLLFYHSLKASSRQSPDRALRGLQWFYLLAVFVGIGLADSSMKVFQSWRPTEETSVFVLSIFASAWVYCGLALRAMRSGLHRASLVRGWILGIPNVLSTVFLLQALKRMDAMLVFPLVNLGIIMLTAVLARLFWSERINRHAVAALMTGVMAVVFLTL